MVRGARSEVTQYKECYQSQYNLPLPPLHHNLAKIYHQDTMKFPLNINTIATVCLAATPPQWPEIIIHHFLLSTAITFELKTINKLSFFLNKG